MPDMKYADQFQRPSLLRVEGVCEINRAAVMEMHRQVGDLHIDDQVWPPEGCWAAPRSGLRMAGTTTDRRSSWPARCP